MLLPGLLHASLALACLLLPSCSSDGREEICDIGHDNAGRLRANCSSRALRDFPTNLRTDVEVLWMSHNDLVSPTWAVLESLPLLKELDLAHNLIASVTPRAALPVSHFDASHNVITDLPPLDFFASLTRLKINDNQIARLPENAFVSVPDLQELFLGNNRLNDVDQSSFTGMDALRMLSLFGNNLASVSADLMSSMINLDVLDITNNNLKSLPTGFFEPVFLSYFYGYQNPWMCDCSVAYFWDWMHDLNDDKVYNSLLQKDIESIVCSDQGPHSATPLYNLDKDAFCPATQYPMTNIALPTLRVAVVKTTSVAATTSPTVPTTERGIPTTTMQKITTAISTTAEVTTAQVADVPSTTMTTLITARVSTAPVPDVPSTLTTTVPTTVDAASTAAPSTAVTSVKATTRAASTARAAASASVTTRAQTTTQSRGAVTRARTTLATTVPTTTRAVTPTQGNLRRPTARPHPTTGASSAQLTQTTARSRATLQGDGAEPTTALRPVATVEDTTARTSQSAPTQRRCLCQPERATTSEASQRSIPCDDRFQSAWTASVSPDDSVSDAVASYFKRLVAPKCFAYGIFPWLLHLVHALIFLVLIYCALQLRAYLRDARVEASLLGGSSRRRRVDHMSRRLQHEIINHPLNVRHRRTLPMGEGTLPSDETKPFIFSLRHVPEKDPGPEVSIVYF